MADIGGILSLLESSPVIAAVRDLGGLRAALATHCQIVFLLGGGILTLEEMVRMARDAGKHPFVHIDLTEGIGKDGEGVRFLARKILPAGLISTRAPLLKTAREEGLLTVQRMFLMDSSAFLSGIRLIQASDPDFIEVMPGLVPEAVSQLRLEVGKPVIAGGMITSKRAILGALSAGAVAVSTSKQELWNA